jgi:hypothetical protein
VAINVKFDCEYSLHAQCARQKEQEARTRDDGCHRCIVAVPLQRNQKTSAKGPRQLCKRICEAVAGDHRTAFGNGALEIRWCNAVETHAAVRLAVPLVVQAADRAAHRFKNSTESYTKVTGKWRF